MDASLLKPCHMTKPVGPHQDAICTRWRGLGARVVLLLLAATVCLAGRVNAQVELPERDRFAPIIVSAPQGCHWTEGAYEVWVLEGDCRIQQGNDSATAAQAVLWIDHESDSDSGDGKVIAYLEEDVVVDIHGEHGDTRLTEKTWLGRFYTAGSIELRVAETVSESDQRPPLYARAVARHRAPSDGAIRRTQFTVDLPATPVDIATPGMRRIKFYPRGDEGFRHESFTEKGVHVVDGGVNLIIDGLSDVNGVPIGTIDVSTERVVVWSASQSEIRPGDEGLEIEDLALELYMEGNIIFRQRDTEIHADRMYYDVNNQVGTVLDAEMLMKVPEYEGTLRLKTELLQQMGPNRFFAQESFMTSSRMGRPGYRIQADSLEFEDISRPLIDPWTGLQKEDPLTHEPLYDHQRKATGSSNTVYLGEVPIFYWPTLSTNLEQPTFYIRRAQFKDDKVFGSQVLTRWNGFQLFGIDNRPEGTDWDLSLDYLGDRGFGHGSTYTYQRDHFFALPGATSGLIDFWGIKDRGLDNLGRGRRYLTPEKDYRYRGFWQHRQKLNNGYQLTGEVGWISDRNFLEQYEEREWDELKDQTTGLELKKLRDNMSWSVSSDAHMNSFFTDTSWLPRGDHFLIGQSLLGDLFTWHEHTRIGYGRVSAKTAPEDPDDLALFRYMPWELDTGGGRVFADGTVFSTRHELDMPLQLGPVKLVPFALGELAHWGEDRTGDDLQRAYGQLGVRASIPFWRVDPTAENRLFNVHGLAHKVVFDAELAVSDSNRDLDLLPLYDPLDDNSVEAFRNRFAVTTYGGVTPMRFDERYYALRSGLGGWVTSPSPEVAGDMATLRFGMRHRWQTKRGKPGEMRIVDWVTFDTHATLFPKPDRDNFGEVLGLVDYDARWHVGDRLTLLSSGMFDFFDQGQKRFTVGGFLNRPPRGGLYVGMHMLEGPFSSSVLSASYNYRMSPKWVSTFGTSMDFSNTGNIGQNFSITRIGESFLISAGFHVDASRDNVGINLSIEPRFLPKTRLGRAGGAQILPAGSFGLE